MPQSLKFKIYKGEGKIWLENIILEAIEMMWMSKYAYDREHLYAIIDFKLWKFLLIFFYWDNESFK